MGIKDVFIKKKEVERNNLDVPRYTDKDKQLELFRATIQHLETENTILKTKLETKDDDFDFSVLWQDIEAPTFPIIQVASIVVTIIGFIILYIHK